MPFGRQATAWEIACAVLFFLSDESVYITAQKRPERHVRRRSLLHDPEKPAPRLMRGAQRFSERIMLKQRDEIMIRFNLIGS